MNKLAKLRQERAEKVKAQKQLLDQVRADDRDFKEEEETRFDALTGGIEDLDKKIQRQIAIDEAEKRAAALEEPADPAPAPLKKGGEEGEKRSLMADFSLKRALQLQLNNKEIDGVEAEVDAIAKEELRQTQGIEMPSRGISIPSSMMLRADSHTVTQDSGEYGGKLVGESEPTLLPTFVDKLAIEDLGVVVKRGLVGNYPLIRGNEFEFQNLDEVQDTTPQKNKYEKRVMKPKRTALETGFSYQLLHQSSINVDQDIRSRATIALNKRLMLDLINGSGTGPNPLGLLNDSEVAWTYSGTEGGLTLQKILEMEGAIDDENVPGNPIFLIHKKLAAIAKGIAIDQGSGRFLMSPNNELYGTRSVKTSHLPALTGEATTYPLIYGDFSNVTAGFWGGMTLIADPYTKAGSNEVRLIINVHRDIMAANPQGFAINKKVTL